MMAREQAAFARGAVVETSRRVERLLTATRAARSEDGLTAEDLLIYLAIGHLGIEASGVLLRVTPRTHLDIARFLDIPRETVRRKIGRLSDRGFTRIVPGGVAVRDVDHWLAHAGALFVPNEPPRKEDRDASAPPSTVREASAN